MTGDQQLSGAERATTSTRGPRTLAVVALGLSIAYAPMWVPSLVRSLGLGLPGDGPMAILWLNWLAVALLLGYVRGVERLSLASVLMIRPRARDLEWAMYFFGGIMAYAWLVRMVRPQPANAGEATISALPALGVVALIVTAAITEEILYRGYPIERLATITGHRWIGAVASLALFVTPHLIFFSPDWLLYQGPGALAIYALYLWRRNLYACMLTHLLINAPILIPTILAR